MTAIKVIFWSATIVIGLLLFSYLAVLGINFQDQAPSPSAIRLNEISAARERIDDDRNAYVYVMGFSIDRNEDPTDWGKKRITWTQQLSQQPSIDPSVELPGKNYDIKHSENSIINELLGSCRQIGNECLSLIEKNEDRVMKGLNTNEWLIRRYTDLLKRPAWIEKITFDARLPLPHYADVLDAQILYYIQAWLLSDTSRPAAIRDMLDADLRFWRHVLASSDILISKMIATAAINRHFNWSNAILRRLPANIVADDMPLSWATPISDQERSMLRCMIGEWQFSNFMIKLTKDGAINALNPFDEISLQTKLIWFFIDPTLKPQDSSNHYAEQVLKMDEVLRVPYDEYPEAVDRARSQWEDSKHVAFPSMIYNFAGRALFSIGDWNPTSYAVRVSDLEGVRRMSILALQLRSREIPSQQVQQQLLESNIRNPYTEEPFEWDDKTSTILFQGLETGDRGRHSVVY